MGYANVVFYFIVLANAATLGAHHITITTVAQAANALTGEQPSVLLPLQRQRCRTARLPTRYGVFHNDLDTLGVASFAGIQAVSDGPRRIGSGATAGLHVQARSG